MGFWNYNKIWLAGVAVIAVVFGAHVASGNVRQLVAPTATLGVALLLLSLLPLNILKLRLEWLRWLDPVWARLGRYRRDLGILAAILFVAHVVSALVAFRVTSVGFLVRPAIVGGTVGLLAFLVMLATSNRFSQKLLGARWRSVQSVVWFVWPIITAHVVIATGLFKREPELESAATLGAIGLFVIFEFVWRHVRGTADATVRRHLWLSLAGTLVAAASFLWR